MRSTTTTELASPGPCTTRPRLTFSLLMGAFGLLAFSGMPEHDQAHVFYELGASAEAEVFLTNWLPEYDRSGVLHGHIVWHGALLALERGGDQRALDLYAQHIAPAANLGVPINVISDTAGFLWRMLAYGHALDPALWRAAADYAAGHFQQAGFAITVVSISATATLFTSIGLDTLYLLLPGPVISLWGFARAHRAARRGIMPAEP